MLKGEGAAETTAPKCTKVQRGNARRLEHNSMGALPQEKKIPCCDSTTLGKVRMRPAPRPWLSGSPTTAAISGSSLRKKRKNKLVMPAWS